MSSQSTQGYVQSVDHFANQQRQPEEAPLPFTGPIRRLPT